MTSWKKIATVFAELIFWFGLLGLAVWVGSQLMLFSYESMQLAWIDQYKTGFVDGQNGDMRIAYQQSLPDFLLKVFSYIGAMLLFCGLAAAALVGLQTMMSRSNSQNSKATGTYEVPEPAVSQPEIISKDGRRYYLIAVPPGTSADDENHSSLTT